MYSGHSAEDILYASCPPLYLLNGPSSYKDNPNHVHSDACDTVWQFTVAEDDQLAAFSLDP